MAATRKFFRFEDWFQKSVLSADVARACRSTVAFAATWIICLASGHAADAVFAATTAQNLALVDARGDYKVRFALLLSMAAVISLSVLAGMLTGSLLWGAVLATGMMAVLGGVWRHLSGDYGPNLAVVSGLLFFIALSQPAGWSEALVALVWVAVGGLIGILVQLSAWFFRPQHALRAAVAESWVAVSDLITAMRTESNEGKPCARAVTEQEGALRSTLDRTWLVLGKARTPSAQLLQHLDQATHLGARLATRAVALNTAFEPMRARSDFMRISPMLDSVLRSLANAARSAALALITHRAEQFIALEVRLQRCNHLLQALVERLSLLKLSESEATQVREMLMLLANLLPDIRAELAVTVDHGSARGGFALRLPELSDLSIRSLSGWLNPARQVDSTLVRYSLRVAVITMLAVAVYKLLAIQHGYWIAFSVLVVLQPDYGSTRKRAGHRITGTFLGCVLATALLWVKPPLGVLVVLASAMAGCFAFYLKRHYGIAIFFVTVMLVLITDAVVPVGFEFTMARVISVLVGGLLALVAAHLFWPKWEREQTPKLIAVAVRANRRYLDAVAHHLQQGKPSWAR